MKLIGYRVTTAFVAGEQPARRWSDGPDPWGNRCGGWPVGHPSHGAPGLPGVLAHHPGRVEPAWKHHLAGPWFSRLKEWAYVGIFFEYTAAVFSKTAVPGFLRGIDDPTALIWTPLMYAVLTLVSWALRPQSRTLGILFPMWARRTSEISERTSRTGGILVKHQHIV